MTTLSYVWRPGDLPPQDLLTSLAPGVTGYLVEYQGHLWLPVITADQPGRGHVGRYLDTLPRDRTIYVPTVMAPRLEEMLRHRGFSLLTMFAAPRLEGAVVGETEPMDVWVRYGRKPL
jgi:hypothetical protein